MDTLEIEKVTPDLLDAVGAKRDEVKNLRNRVREATATAQQARVELQNGRMDAATAAQAQSEAQILQSVLADQEDALAGLELIQQETDERAELVAKARELRRLAMLAESQFTALDGMRQELHDLMLEQSSRANDASMDLSKTRTEFGALAGVSNNAYEFHKLRATAERLFDACDIPAPDLAAVVVTHSGDRFTTLVPLGYSVGETLAQAGRVRDEENRKSLFAQAAKLITPKDPDRTTV